MNKNLKTQALLGRAGQGCGPKGLCGFGQTVFHEGGSNHLLKLRRVLAKISLEASLPGVLPCSLPLLTPPACPFHFLFLYFTLIISDHTPFSSLNWRLSCPTLPSEIFPMCIALCWASDRNVCATLADLRLLSVFRRQTCVPISMTQVGKGTGECRWTDWTQQLLCTSGNPLAH